MQYFSSSKFISYQFCIDNDEGKSGIVYEMIMGHDLMIQIGLAANFKSNVLEWDDDVMQMKYTANLL